MSGTKYPNVTEVRHQARADWEKQFKRRMSIQERIRESIPWWLVIVAGVFFLLSVPHTMVVFDKITPTWGKTAPFGIEFGLLYASFRRRVGQRTVQLTILEVLLFLTAILVNGAGSLEAVVKSTRDVQGLSVADLLSQLGDLPATSQVALILVPAAAFIIPIGTVAAGEGLAALALEYRESGNLMFDQWERESQHIEFTALRDAAINMGHTPTNANKWARQVVGLSTRGQARNSADVSGADKQPDNRRTPQGHGTGQGYSKNMDAKTAVFAYLDTYGYDDLSVRELASRVSDQFGPVGKSTAHEALTEWRASHNGHNQPHDD